jgi:hypothetical protein
VTVRAGAAITPIDARDVAIIRREALQIVAASD